MSSKIQKSFKEEYRHEFEEMCRTSPSSERYDDDLTALDMQGDSLSSNQSSTIDESLFNTVIGDGTLMNQPGSIDTSLDDILNGDVSLQTETVPQNHSEPILFSLHGEQMEGNLIRPFTVEQENIYLQQVDDIHSIEYSIHDLDYICLQNLPESMDADTVTAPENIETFCGSRFTANVPVRQENSVGIFCLDHSFDKRFKYLFIPACNIKNRYYAKPIGEILLELNLINKMTLVKVLEQQKKMRRIKFGQILERRAKLEPGTVNRILQNSTVKELTGQILKKAGLVSEKQVAETVKLQKGVRNRKIGALLVKQGDINEDDLYTVLAEKFRKSFVNLYDVFFCKESGDVISCNLIKKLKVLPLSMVNGRLHLVTSHPEVPQVADILRKNLNCPFELSVTTASQLKSAIIDKCRK